MESLDDYRDSIDNIDNAILAMFAERFKVTNKVGQYKAEQGLPAKDETREAAQFERISGLAETYGLDPEFARDLLRTVIDKVVQNHIDMSRIQSAKSHDK
ncbi:chorismate mutase [Marinomonas sp. THO17]|uniref:chorismate mutase n=1 Tax=Marinomonas sp. THO17 TaxID=3149048 RepID=UPI00336BB79F